ncbi:MAG: iron-siderophore ABC transporter substrate-binding protein, partial [Pleurocapsa sp.]
FLLGILIVFAIAACNSNTSTKPNAFLTDNCRVMLHAMGETCVPLDPQRIVVLDSVMLEAAIALDKKPVGSPLSYVPSPISITDITDLGDIEAINLERVLSLKPDLILGIADSASPYSQLSQIAPTVLINFDHSGEWKKHFAFVGEVLGKSEQVKQIMADYYQRTEEFKQKINAGSNDLERNSNNEILVSVVRIYPTEITVYTKVGFPGTILEDAGLSRPPSQDLDLEQTEVLNFSAIQYPISKEVIDKADGDAVFVVVGNWDLEIKDVLASLTTDPLWSTLDAVQQGKVYEVGDYWVGNGPIAANAVLDDLFKYLIPLM